MKLTIRSALVALAVFGAIGTGQASEKYSWCDDLKGTEAYSDCIFKAAYKERDFKKAAYIGEQIGVRAQQAASRLSDLRSVKAVIDRPDYKPTPHLSRLDRFLISVGIESAPPFNPVSMFQLPDETDPVDVARQKIQYATEQAEHIMQCGERLSELPQEERYNTRTYSSRGPLVDCVKAADWFHKEK